MHFHCYRTGVYRLLSFLDKVYGLAVVPTTFQERKDRTPSMIRRHCKSEDSWTITNNTVDKWNSEKQPISRINNYNWRETRQRREANRHNLNKMIIRSKIGYRKEKNYSTVRC